MVTIRSLAETPLKDRVRRRALPVEFSSAPIYMSAAAGLGAILKLVDQVDPVLLRTAALLVRRVDIVWDIGGNIGLFSIAAAVRAGSTGQVFAFEPDPMLIQLLRASARLQSSSTAPISVIPAAVADTVGVRDFWIAKRARSSNALAGHGLTQMGGVRETISVVTLTIDDCLAWLPRPTLLRVDIEGAEFQALSSATELLSAPYPTLICEVAGANAERVTDLLRSAGFRLYDPSRPNPLAREIEVATPDTIAIHDDNAALYH